MKIIFHNDDFGVSHGVNSGIKEAYLKGLTTSASIRTNGPAFDEAANLTKTKLKGMGLGIHLNLTDGKPHTTDLMNKSGYYKYNFVTYLILTSIIKNKNILKSIEKELGTQFEICFNKQLKVDHVDGQDHIQMVPEIFNIICKLCKKYKIHYVRLSREPYYPVDLPDDIRPFINLSIIKLMILNYLAKKCLKILKKNKLKTTDAFYGVLHTNHMNPYVIKSIINYSLKRNYSIIQIACHPANINNPSDKIYTSPFFEKYANLKNRKNELKALLNRSLIKFIKAKDINKAKFADIG